MATHDLVKLFDDRKVRVFYDDESQLWYFCIADVVEILTDSRDVPQYIKRMRQRDTELNSVWGTICTPPTNLNLQMVSYTTPIVLL